MRYKIKYLQANQLKETTLKAQSPQEAKDILIAQGYIPLEIQELPTLTNLLPISSKEIIASLWQLSLMISASIPLSQSLNLLKDHCPNAKLKRIFASIENSVENGVSLPEAFAPYVHIFGDLSLAMISSGSKSGNLSHTLKLLINELKIKEKNQKAIKKALFYPSIVLFSTLACFAFVLIFVLPNFAQIFAQNSISLPLSTRFLFALSHFFSQYSLSFFLAVLGGVGMFILWIKSKKGRAQDLLLALPYIGEIFKSSYIQRYCLSLEILLNSGIPLLQSHIIAQSSFSSSKISNALCLTQEALKNGKSLCASLKESKLFTPLDLALLQIAQHSGKVEEILNILSKEYAEKMQERIEKIIAVLEPLLTLLLGGFILLLALGIFVPIWEMGA
ncbi:type II secretion system F family protein [Helicobacter cholecystus]|uniref:Type II secretion system F family protein n=1 Tax=Helicobacter cholecystus TaxID=45498 RepID=A0A3D8IZ57_9HELI|nr:type II secretion system F family protein [Helicobacter cholecystus]RDU69841.1 type II secretion system F family protein [Helicobacter cholecystus]VEJ25815.1 putative type II secretion system protein [Helicobacter cholecystus]